jgi:hypothetical protein
MRWEGMDWINLAQDRRSWRGLVNTVMNLQVFIFWPAERILLYARGR